MPRLEGPHHTVDIEWDKGGKPIQYVTGKGKVDHIRDALAAIALAVKMIEESEFHHVCAVYNLLEVTHIPHLARFVGSGRIHSTPRTAHIVMATHDKTLQLVGRLIAVSNNRRLRTTDICTSVEEIEAAVQRWWNLPDRTREYTVDNK